MIAKLVCARAESDITIISTKAPRRNGMILRISHDRTEGGTEASRRSQRARSACGFRYSRSEFLTDRNQALSVQPSAQVPPVRYPLSRTAARCWQPRWRRGANQTTGTFDEWTIGAKWFQRVRTRLT